MSILAIIYVLFVHWCADFLGQNRWMADNKSTSWLPLTAHVLTYSIIFWLALLLVGFDIRAVSCFCLANFMMHWITDFVTSKMTKHYWSEHKIHAFFCMVGFDQFIHNVTLLLTMEIWLR